MLLIVPVNVNVIATAPAPCHSLLTKLIAEFAVGTSNNYGCHGLLLFNFSLPFNHNIRGGGFFLSINNYRLNGAVVLGVKGPRIPGVK